MTSLTPVGWRHTPTASEQELARTGLCHGSTTIAADQVLRPLATAAGPRPPSETAGAVLGADPMTTPRDARLPGCAPQHFQAGFRRTAPHHPVQRCNR